MKWKRLTRNKPLRDPESATEILEASNSLWQQISEELKPVFKTSDGAYRYRAKTPAIEHFEFRISDDGRKLSLDVWVSGWTDETRAATAGIIAQYIQQKQGIESSVERLLWNESENQEPASAESPTGSTIRDTGDTPLSPTSATEESGERSATTLFAPT